MRERRVGPDSALLLLEFGPDSALLLLEFGPETRARVMLGGRLTESLHGCIPRASAPYMEAHGVGSLNVLPAQASLLPCHLSRARDYELLSIIRRS